MKAAAIGLMSSMDFLNNTRPHVHAEVAVNTDFSLAEDA